MNSIEVARATIYAQPALLSVKRSALALYRHELTRIDPETKKRYTHHKALHQTLRWMAIQMKRGDMSDIQLTTIQEKIVRLLVLEGLPAKAIAVRLGKSHGTIKKNLSEIRARTGLNSTYQVIAVAVEYGWVSAPLLKEQST